jgi:hypothetical protein
VKVFALRNDNTESTFDYGPTVWNGDAFHSGGIVVAAETLEEAQNFAGDYIAGDKAIRLVEVDISFGGVIIYADGMC